MNGLEWFCLKYWATVNPKKVANYCQRVKCKHLRKLDPKKNWILPMETPNRTL